MRRHLLPALALTAAFLLGACSDDDEPTPGPTAEEGTTTTTTEVEPSSTTVSAPDPAAVAFPPENTDLSHGGETWAVVLAGSTSGTEAPELVEAVRVAQAAGYRTGPTDCDEGADQALGLQEAEGGDAIVYTVSVYLRTEEDAQAALEAFHQSGFDGGAVAQLRTYCMD